MEETIKILGVKVNNLESKELNAKIAFISNEKLKAAILNVNIHCINLAIKHSWLKQFLNNSEMVFCDGDGVRLGAKMLGYNIKEKITYNRWIWDFAKFSEEQGLSWYLVGSSTEVINTSVNTLKIAFPNLNILGARNGFFNDNEDIETTVCDINNKKPNILILGMGMPLQERWLLENYDRLSFNIALTGGAVFDYISGFVKMTPDIFYRLKLEWFYRFLGEPKRLFKRYFVGNPLFFYRVLLQRFQLRQF